MKTNFSHIISVENHTEAASWIVQLSSDSPDINFMFDPDEVYMKTEEQSSVQLSSLVCDSQTSYTADSRRISPSYTADSQRISPSYTAASQRISPSYTADSQGSFPSYTSSLTGDSQCIPAYSLYVVATIVLFAVVFTLAVVFVVLYLYKKHIGPCCHDPQQAEPNNVILEQLVVMQPYDEPNNEEEELVEMPPNDEPDNELQMQPNDEPNNELQI